MQTEPVIGQRNVELTLDVSARPAERLRVRKGQMINFMSLSGEDTLRRVTKVSMPDASGRSTVYTEPV